MIYRSFGKTGKEVSALGMGCMRFEAPDRPEEMAEIVLRAHDRGVTYFDTAPFYCNDKSEEIVGLAVTEMKKGDRPFFITSKTTESKEEKIRPMVERSLERLNVDAIDFYHVWCLVHPGDFEKRKADGVLDTFRALKEEGLIRHICVSTHLNHEFVEEMLDQDEGLFEGMLIGLNAANFPLRIQGVEAAARRGIGVVTMNTLGGGMLTKNAEHFQFLKGQNDESVLEAALRFNLSLPDVTVALVGFRNKEDVDSAADVVERFEPLSAYEIEGYKQHVLESSEDFCTECNYCRDCPEDIPVVRFMEAYNQKLLAGGDPKAAPNQLKWHWGIQDVEGTLALCTQCGHCVEVCTQHLPILDRFEEIKEDARLLRREKQDSA